MSMSVFEKTEISSALQADDFAIDLPNSANQLNLFDRLLANYRKKIILFIASMRVILIRIMYSQ